MKKEISEKDRIEILRKFFRISNTGINCATSIQAALTGRVIDTPIYHLHRMALTEVEKDNPNLEIIDYLLMQMELLAEENTQKPSK